MLFNPPREVPKPVKIFIGKLEHYPLRIEEVKYVFRVLFNIAGIPFHFLPLEDSGKADIFFDTGFANFARCKINIKMSQKNEFNPGNVFIEEYNHLIFLNFNDFMKNTEPVISIENDTIYINNDIVLGAFYCLTGWQEEKIDRDKKDRHDIKGSFLYQNNLLHEPIVNHYALFLREIFQEKHGYIPSWPNKKRFAVALSHDVDYPEIIKTIELLRYLVIKKFHFRPKKLFDIINGKESFWCFEDWVKLERQYNFKSAFFFCGFKGNLLRYFFKAPDPFYDISSEKFRRIISFLKENGFEIGLHSSYHAFSSVERFASEKRKVESVSQEPVSGNRHHYWHMNPEAPSETSLIHNKIGFIYDSSIVFEKHSGFRYAICSPFHLYHRPGNRIVKTLQIPPSLMDDHLFGHSKLHHFKDSQSHIDFILESIIKAEGILMADYHVRVLNDTFFPHWGQSYKYLLDRIIGTGEFYCDIPKNIARYWIERESFLLNYSKDER